MPENNKTDFQPDFDFLGFNVQSITFSQKLEERRHIQSFFVKAQNPKLEGSLFSFSIVVRTEGKMLKGEFDYQTAFALNNPQLIEDAKKNQFDFIQDMFAVVFPFLRESVFAITNDSLGHIFLPVLNMRDINVLHGASFVRRASSNGKSNSQNQSNKKGGK